MINERNYLIGKDPYEKARIINYGKGDFSLEKKIPTVRYSNKDKLHTVLEGETLQHIAFKYYGDSGYWYYLAEANNILNPLNPEEFYPGLNLIIPKYGLIE